MTFYLILVFVNFYSASKLAVCVVNVRKQRVYKTGCGLALRAKTINVLIQTAKHVRAKSPFRICQDDSTSSNVWIQTSEAPFGQAGALA
ncbi:MAG: hypothetical protein ACI9NN_001394 [Bacteroidia bacterium]|jgi:hypothetical protein